MSVFLNSKYGFDYYKNIKYSWWQPKPVGHARENEREKI